MLPAAALAALGAVFAVYLDDVQGVVDHGGVRDRAADAVSVADGVEVEDVVNVDAARGEDPDMREPVAVELPAHLAHEIPEVPAAVARRVHPDGVDRGGGGAGGPQRPELLVVEGVDDDGAGDLGADR